MKIILKYPRNRYDKGKISHTIGNHTKNRELCIILDMKNENVFDKVQNKVIENNGSFEYYFKYNNIIFTLLLEFFRIFRQNRIKHTFTNQEHINILKKLREYILIDEKKRGIKDGI